MESKKRGGAKRKRRGTSGKIVFIDYYFVI